MTDTKPQTFMTGLDRPRHVARSVRPKGAGKWPWRGGRWAPIDVSKL